MWVEGREIELAGDEEQHGSHGFEAGVSPRLALGRLKQAVDGFNEAIGLARLGPGDDTVEMTKDHACDVLHGFDLGTHDAGAPPSQHLGDDVDLLAIENLAQLLAVHPGTGGAVGGVLADQRFEISQLREVQLVSILEQRPADDLLRLAPFEEELLAMLDANDLTGFLRSAVRHRLNIAVSGSTGSGKTTLARTLMLEVPAAERVLLMEDVH